MRILAVHVIANMIQDEQQVDEVAGCSESLASCVWVCEGTEKPRLTLLHDSVMFLVENIEASDPLPALCTALL
jgi:hypothetical protein